MERSKSREGGNVGQTQNDGRRAKSSSPAAGCFNGRKWHGLEKEVRIQERFEQKSGLTGVMSETGRGR